MIPVLSARSTRRFALAAGAAWSALSALSLAIPDPTRALDVFFILPFALTIPAVVGIHALKQPAGRLEQWGFRLSVTGMTALLGAQVGLIADIEVLKQVVLPIGVAAWVIGLILFGIGTARARVLPAWSGAAIALSQPITVLFGLALSPISPLSSTGDYSGAIGHGVIWLAIGMALRFRTEIAARRVPAAA